jgi:CBS-domain-containing membrane protein
MRLPAPIRLAFKLLWCLCGAGAGLAAALWLTGPPHSPFLLASLGGTAVFLFGLTKAPAGQPRAVLGGHLGGAALGVACYQLLGDTMASYVVAEMLTLGWMLLARAVHPPAGANPLLMIHVHADWSALWSPVLLSVTVMMLVAAVWSRLVPGMNRYPVSVMEPSPGTITWGAWER